MEPFTRKEQELVEREERQNRAVWLRSPEGRAEMERLVEEKKRTEEAGKRERESLFDDLLKHELSSAYAAKDCAHLGYYRPGGYRTEDGTLITTIWVPRLCRFDVRQRWCEGKCTKYQRGIPAWQQRERILNDPGMHPLVPLACIILAIALVVTFCGG